MSMHLYINTIPKNLWPLYKDPEVCILLEFYLFGFVHIFLSHLLTIDFTLPLQFQGIPKHLKTYFEIIDNAHPEENLYSLLKEFAQKMAGSIILSDYMGTP